VAGDGPGDGGTSDGVGGGEPRAGLGGGGPIDDVGGASSSTGDAGEGGAPADDVPRCVPGQSIACACVSGQSGAQTCDGAGRYQQCVCAEGSLAWFRAKMVGVWVGMRTTPWATTTGPPATVTLEFMADGTWIGSCDQTCGPVFYYGSSKETSQNQYELDRYNEDLLAYGRIRLTWDDGDFTEGDLRKIHFDSNETRLTFEFWATWGGEYGPISFDLQRQ
jgi:hypothetical protein